MTNRAERRYVWVAALLLTGGCSQQHRDLREAINKAKDRKVYVMQNGVEAENYNRRQMVADDPTAILWCTASLDAPQGGLVTIPVIGKLTSSQKRPFPHDGPGESPGPDAMYGTSGEYRYGFAVNGRYVDFTNVATMCFDAPMDWQMKNTKVILNVDEDMFSAQERARAVLRQAKRDRVTGEYPKKTLDCVGRILSGRVAGTAGAQTCE